MWRRIQSASFANRTLAVVAFLSYVVSASFGDEPKPLPPANRQDVIEWRDNEGAHPVKTVEDWRKFREQFLLAFQEVSGPLPDFKKLPPLDVQITETDDTPARFTRYKLSYLAEPGDRVPAYLLVPKQRPGASPAKFPAMLALHQTNGALGKREPAALAGSPNLMYGAELADRGYVVLIPDYPSLGEYRYDFQKSPHLSGTMKGIVNHLRGVDLLVQRSDVDPQRIGTIGHSLGGHNSVFAALFDERLKVVVTCCGWTPKHDYYNGNINGWAGERYFPLIKTRYHTDPDQVPFDFYGLIASLAPRGFYSISPLRDQNFAVAGVRKVEAVVAPIYALHGAEKRFAIEYPDCEHDFPPDARERAYQFVDAILHPETVN